MSHNKRTRRLQAAKAAKMGRPRIHPNGYKRDVAQKEYKKDWDKEVLGGVEWRGYLLRESDDHEVGIGWCNKGLHYIDWDKRHGHLEECMWRGGRLYGK